MRTYLRWVFSGVPMTTYSRLAIFRELPPSVLSVADSNLVSATLRLATIGKVTGIGLAAYLGYLAPPIEAIGYPYAVKIAVFAVVHRCISVAAVRAMDLRLSPIVEEYGLEQRTSVAPSQELAEKVRSKRRLNRPQ